MHNKFQRAFNRNKNITTIIQNNFLRLPEILDVQYTLLLEHIKAK